MTVQLVDIFYPNVFKRYSVKYDIFRDLYEKDLLALEVRDVNLKLAHRVKKIILSNKEICYTAKIMDSENVDLLALGSIGIFKELAKEILAIGNEDLGYKVSKTIKNFTGYENQTIFIGGKSFKLNNALVMGIVNVTPDSFSDGGKFLDVDKATEHALKLIDEGAEIIDIGGESSRPGSEPVDDIEELNRILPVIEKVNAQKPGTLISVDTTKSRVADEACKRGAKIINDISSFGYDKNILQTAVKHKAGLILMHMKGSPKNMQNNPFYDDVVSEVYDYMLGKVSEAQKEGVQNVFVDPGIGFGKRVEDNFEILRKLGYHVLTAQGGNEFKGIGVPIVIGVSRKSFLGKAFDLEVDKRGEPTLAAETISIKNGARIVRTHDVKKAKIASKMNDFIENPEQLLNA